MRKKRRNLFYTVLFVGSLLFFLLHNTPPAFAQEYKESQVLILNSYHQGMIWTDEETDGIISEIREAEKNVSFHVEYMDWKNYASNRNWSLLHEYYKYKYADKKLDIILTTDDAALIFALRYRLELFSNAPIVFCGVNKEGVELITKGFDRVTGVIEEVDPTKTLEFAYSLNPQIKKINIIYDNSESGRSTGQIVKEAIKKFNPKLEVIPWNKLSFEEVTERAGQVNEDEIILFCTYYSDVKNNIVAMDYATREVCKASKGPVYGIFDFGLNQGIVGGTLVSGRLQGENAGKLANHILEGEDPDHIPIESPDCTRTIFDYNQLIRFHIGMDQLPKGSTIINKPFSFYETYKPLVIIVATVFFLLISFTSILIINVRKLRKMKQTLSENNEELTQLNEELIATDEELMKQYKEIVVVNERIRESDEKLTYLAYHDSLTGLSNKLSLYNKAKAIFRPEAGASALLFIDIDNFKYVNDTLGHEFGDKLIIDVSNTLSELLYDNSSLYRLSGDEFIILFEQIEDTKQVEQFALHLLSGFFKDFEYQSNLHVSLSIGIALYPQHGTDLDDLLKCADIAMYKVKETGKKGYVIYNKEMNEAFVERVSIEKNLKKALDSQEFILFYQPQLDLRSNRITGLEALLRWISPDLGNVSVLKLINVAEDTHFIIPLGEWVLRNACIFLKRLEKLGYGEIGVSVNISILQLLQEDFVDKVMELIHSYQIRPELLELEITESILVESFDRIKTKLQQLREFHVRTALDDFGKGYSSLSYLKQLPITTMKIDKSFIDHISEQGEDDYVRNIISLGKNLGMEVVAEGVEEKHQLDYLVKSDCDKIQGFWFSRPKSEEDIIRMLGEEAGHET